MKRLDAVTEEQWSGVCEFNRNLLNSFLSDSVELSPKSKKSIRIKLKNLVCMGKRQSKQ